jgi:hypothetical protein
MRGPEARAATRFGRALVLGAAVAAATAAHAAPPITLVDFTLEQSVYARFATSDTVSAHLRALDLDASKQWGLAGGDGIRAGLGVRYGGFGYAQGGAAKNGLYLGTALRGGYVQAFSPTFAVGYLGALCPYTTVAVASVETRDVNGEPVRTSSLTQFSGKLGLDLAAEAVKSGRLTWLAPGQIWRVGARAGLLYQTFDRVHARVRSSRTDLAPDEPNVSGAVGYKLMALSLGLIGGFAF